MKTNRILLFLCTLFICMGMIAWCEAAAPSYERMKTLIWQHTIHFIYEDNGMMEQYRQNYGTHFFSNVANFDSLKNDALEKSFFLSVEQEVNTEGVAKKVMLEQLASTIAGKLSIHPNRKNDPTKLAKVDSLQRILYQLIHDEYQPTQYQQPASNAEEIIELLPDTDTSSL